MPWDTIKANPPEQLKVSPVAMAPHKSCPYWAILDLTFSIYLRLNNDPILKKKLLNGDGEWANMKEVLGLMFDGNNMTIWLIKTGCLTLNFSHVASACTMPRGHSFYTVSHNARKTATSLHNGPSRLGIIFTTQPRHHPPATVCVSPSV